MDFLAEINKSLNEIESDDDVRCIVISGSGNNFCGGADFSAFASGKVDSVLRFSDTGHNVFTRIETFPKPIIAAINGPALGGGLELAMACDIRVMNRKAQLRLPEITLGITPGWGGTQRLIRLIGGTRAKEIVLLGEPVLPDKALEWGLVNYVVESNEFDVFVDNLAQKLANSAPVAQKLIKALFYYGSQGDQRSGAFLETTASAGICFTEDANEGLTSMFYRRSPKFKGE